MDTDQLLMVMERLVRYNYCYLFLLLLLMFVTVDCLVFRFTIEIMNCEVRSEARTLQVVMEIASRSISLKLQQNSTSMRTKRPKQVTL